MKRVWLTILKSMAMPARGGSQIEARQPLPDVCHGPSTLLGPELPNNAFFSPIVAKHFPSERPLPLR
jgi:hypothetical protein